MKRSLALVCTASALLAVGCASSTTNSPSARVPVVPSTQAGRIQTAKTGSVVSVKDVMIRPDLGDNYSIGRQIGSSVARGSVGGIASAVGGMVGQNVENAGRTAPGQLIEIELDDGTVVTVAQGMEPLLYEGARVTVKIIGEMAVVELLEDPNGTKATGVAGT